jgi:hypothetical protein
VAAAAAALLVSEPRRDRGATFLVGLWRALGADTGRMRIWRLMFPVPLAVLVAGFVGLLPGALILCT